jgi:hypothetical protein
MRMITHLPCKSTGRDSGRDLAAALPHRGRGRSVKCSDPCERSLRRLPMLAGTVISLAAQMSDRWTPGQPVDER